jgi:hypothetical protein
VIVVQAQYLVQMVWPFVAVVERKTSSDLALSPLDVVVGCLLAARLFFSFLTTQLMIPPPLFWLFFDDLAVTD